MKIYGYCRVSTPKQSIQRQIDNITAIYNDVEIIIETYTGNTSERPKWSQLKRKVLKQAEQGEQITIVFDSVSRMSRKADEGFREYQELFYKGISLVFLKEPHINTETYKQAMNRQLDVNADTGDTATDKMINAIIGAVQEYQLALAEKQIMLAFEQSEKEVSDLRMRTKEGMKASGAGAKISKAKTGRTFETKKALRAKEIIKKYSKTFGGTLPDTECRILTGVSRNTFYEYKKALKKEKIHE
ncbi:MAG: recombinase family protein [Ruminococcus sp.]|nr:recombinase family protein [Ruminococcus sp.]